MNFYFQNSSYRCLYFLFVFVINLIYFGYILITFEIKMIRNCLIINVMFIQNDTLWVYTHIDFLYILITFKRDRCKVNNFPNFLFF